MNKRPLLALVPFVVLLTGCNKKGSQLPPEAKDKVVINVGTHIGGIKDAWIKKLAKEFNEKYTDYTDSTFPEGKTGVYFNVLMNEKYSGEHLDNGLTMDIYFTEGVDYAKLSRKNMLLDISDVITDNLSDMGDTGTIEDKIDPLLASYLKSYNNKYYGLPYYEGFHGLVYDVDVFDREQLFFGQDGNIGKVSTDTDLSYGVDGIPGTYDDGLPATFDEFGVLLENMRGFCNPIGYAGANASGYVERMCHSIFSTYEGKEGANLNYTFNGTTNSLINVSDSGEVTKDAAPTTISSYNTGYELQRQAGKYYALKFAQEYLLNKDYNPKGVGGFEHVDAQRYFVESKYSTSKTDTSIGLLVEGSWWENEASSALLEDASKHPGEGGRENRRFAFMPIPVPSEEYLGRKQCLSNINSSFAFVNAKTEHPELCKKIMKFFHTNHALSSFTETTSITRSFTYTIENHSGISYFAKKLIELKNDGEVIQPYSSCEEVINRPSYFPNNTYPWSVGESVRGFVKLFVAKDSTYGTAEKYFKSMYSFAKNTWNK